MNTSGGYVAIVASPIFLVTRLSENGDRSIFVLSEPGGRWLWSRSPVKPDGELGPVEFGGAHLTWYGGWRVAIHPGNQETGSLYLGPSGGFRFFNHSW